MKPWINASAQFNRSRKQFCPGAQLFARRKTLGQAWGKCQVGSFMAWWLFEYRGMRAVDIPVDASGDRFFGRDINQQPYADKLRATFRADGTRR